MRSAIFTLLCGCVVVGLLAAASAGAQDEHGSIVEWGRDDFGQCDVPAPNADFMAVAAGGNYHSLGLKSDGSIIKWPVNDVPDDPVTATMGADEDSPTSTPAVAEPIFYSGVVFDAGGRPVAGVEIRSYLSDARDWSAHREIATATTDDGGRFRIGPLPQLTEPRPRRHLWLDHPDYGLSAMTHHLWSEAQPDIEHLRLVLPLPSTARGRVTDEAGHPIGNARVTAQVWWHHRVFGSEKSEFLVQKSNTDLGARTDEDGRFVLARLPRRGKLHLFVEHPDYSRFWSGGANGHAPMYRVNDDDIHITLLPGGKIRGHLVHDGQPFRHAGLTVYAVAVNEQALGVGNFRPVVTDDAGRFLFQSLPPGAYFVHARPYDALEPGLVVTPAWDVVATLQPATDLELRVVDGIPVRGKLVDIHTGAAVPIARRQARVEAEFVGAPRGRTTAGDADEGAAGRFKMYLPPGEYQLGVWFLRHNALTERFTLVAGKPPPPMTLRVEPPSTSSGRANDP